MRLWRKSASPEPAAAENAAAGARYTSAKERLKGDAQETARQRLMIASVIFGIAFTAVGLRMGYVSLLRDGAEPTQRVAARGGSIQSERADIVDRNGAVLATSVPVMSAFVNPHLLLDPQEAARKIVTALPDLKYDDVREKLEGDRTFVWIKRGLSPARARPRQPPRHSRPRVPGRGTSHLSAGYRRRSYSGLCQRRQYRPGGHGALLRPAAPEWRDGAAFH